MTSLGAGSAEGLRAWQLLVERYDPHIRLRTAGQLLSLLQFDFSGDMLAKLEAYERDLALYEQASGDGLRVGIVLNRVTDTELATHLLLNSERFQTWALFRRELVDVSCARAAVSGAYQMRRGANDSSTAPMEVDALQQHGDKKCHTCGIFGHLSKDCWQNKSKSKGKDSKGTGGKKGKGKSKGNTDKDVCLKCGQRGHWAKNCRDPAKASPAAEIKSLEGHAAERITFGVDGAALTWQLSTPECRDTRRMTDCQGNPVVNLGQKEPGLEGTDRQEFRKSDRGVSSQELAVGELLVEDGHEVVFSSGKSYIQHLKTDARQPIV